MFIGGESLANDEAMRKNYVEYGRRLENMIQEIRK